MFHVDRQADAAARLKRFATLFRAQERIYDLTNDLLGRNTIRLRDGQEDLSLLVGASLALALKTFSAVRDLSFLGWGEDALVLVRSNVNLLINLGYILNDPNPLERADDFIAYSYLERVKYQQTAHGIAMSPWTPRDDPATMQMRAKRWKDVSIRDRTEGVPEFHYTKGYTLYSSFEHSDAIALNGYIAAWDSVGPRVNAAPSDDCVTIALGHNVMVLADVISLFALHFGLTEKDVFDQIQEVLNSMVPPKT
jgi:hypothetical protein